MPVQLQFLQRVPLWQAAVLSDAFASKDVCLRALACNQAFAQMPPGRLPHADAM